MLFRKIHGNYVDCVRWYGDLVISKGVDERIMIFKPLDLPTDRFRTSEAYVTLLVHHHLSHTLAHNERCQEFDMGPCEVWYVRFALDFGFHVLACGDQEGRIHVWDMRWPPIIERSCLAQKKCSTVVQTTSAEIPFLTLDFRFARRRYRGMGRSFWPLGIAEKCGDGIGKNRQICQCMCPHICEIPTVTSYLFPLY